MNPKIISLALSSLASLALAPQALATAVIIQVCPTNVSQHPISVQITNGDFGDRFTVLYRTNEATLDQFLHASLLVASADNQIVECPIQRIWTTNGVKFEFTVSSSHVVASKFTLDEAGHVGKMPMPAFTRYWFYLRDFAPAKDPRAGKVIRSNFVPPEVIKALPERLGGLRAGTRRDDVWKELQLASYRGKLGGVSYSEHERFWLTWNYELELIFEGTATNSPDFEEGNRKLVRAILYKNGLEISISGK
jgi:hypothetical protein